VETAVACYWTEGVRNVSVNEICRRAHVSKPSVYREFGGEDGLMEAAIDHYFASMIVPLRAALASDEPFTAVLERLLHMLTEPSGRPAGCLLAELRSAPAYLGPMTAARVDVLAEEQRQLFEDWFRRALARSEVDPTIAPALAANFIDTQLTTVLLQMGRGADPQLVRDQATLAFRALLRPAGP
jgi:AcrR family transcriptional regulator